MAAHMQGNAGRQMKRGHATEEALEQYALGRLSDADAAPVEEHLLVCSLCQDRLQVTDAFIRALRAAVESRRTGQKEPPEAASAKLAPRC